MELLHTVGLIVFVAMVLPFIVMAVPQSVGADHSYVVTSGSMEPAIAAGSVVFVTEVPARAIHKGDVITYTTGNPGASSGTNNRITHRVIEVVNKNSQRHFQTKGDANEESDSTLVPAQNIIGRVTFHVPFLGYVITYAHSDRGLFALLIIPGVLLIVTEIWELGKDLRASRTPTDRTTPTNNTEDRDP